ncbi:MAG: signal peptide peptidase SppA [Candidatus Obscuribacterales bacterium]|nr:signal peptide peptidase SppA [Candidatus Obscuribacterales bacterium]
MQLNKGQRILGWLILLVCLLALPLQMISKSGSAAEKKEEPQWSSLLLSKKDRILVLRLNGLIAENEDGPSFFSDSTSASDVRKALIKAAKNKHIKAVLLRINSPGGTVATSQEICDAVKAVREKGKPVLISMGDVAASGGYYIASAADCIVADPGTLTGSIGVIMHLLNLQQIEKKIGIEPVVIKSGIFKDIGSSDRPMSKEEKALLQSIIMDSYDQFITAVADGRKMDKEKVRKLADGRIYSGRQALKVGLVDKLGGYELALETLQTMAKDKYHLRKNLPVDDGRHSLEAIENMFASSNTDMGSGASLLKGIIPQSMNPKYCNQPLWLMQ